MSDAWTRHDDSTYFINLGKAMLVAVIYDRMGQPGWKVQVGKRSVKDKLPTLEDAQKVALVLADRVVNQCRAELDALKAAAGE